MPPAAEICAALLLAAGVTWLAVPPVRRLAERTDFLDHPVGYKQHGRSTPYLGGLAVMLGFLAAAIPFGGAPLRLRFRSCSAPSALWVVGTVDDKVGLGPGSGLRPSSPPLPPSGAAGPAGRSLSDAGSTLAAHGALGSGSGQRLQPDGQHRRRHWHGGRRLRARRRGGLAGPGDELLGAFAFALAGRLRRLPPLQPRPSRRGSSSATGAACRSVSWSPRSTMVGARRSLGLAQRSSRRRRWSACRSSTPPSWSSPASGAAYGVHAAAATT